MQFKDKDDTAMRQRILDVLKDIDRAVVSRHVKTFEVVRTYERKGYRDERPFFLPDQSPYQSYPMTLFRIEIEVPDDTTPALPTLVAELTQIEAVGKRAAQEAKLEQFKAARDVAQRAVDELERELNAE